jgi:hypothetical protein
MHEDFKWSQESLESSGSFGTYSTSWALLLGFWMLKQGFICAGLRVLTSWGSLTGTAQGLNL